MTRHPILTKSSPPRSRELASRLSRLVALILDGITAGACAALSTWLGSEIVGSLCWLAVYIFLMAEYGQTPGKALMQIRIVRTDGRPVGFLRGGILRNVAVPALLMAVLVLIAQWAPAVLAGSHEVAVRGVIGTLMLASHLPIFGRSRRTLPDYLAGTIVVRST